MVPIYLTFGYDFISNAFVYRNNRCDISQAQAYIRKFGIFFEI